MSRTHRSTAKLGVTLTHSSRPTVRFIVPGLENPDVVEEQLVRKLAPYKRELKTDTYDIIVPWALRFCPQGARDLAAKLADYNNQHFTFTCRVIPIKAER